MLKRLLNLPESVTDARLREICAEFDANVNPKVRVADVFEIEASGIADQLYTFALKSHFDFVITGPDHIPIFGVEFDGPGHRSAEAKRRDQLKNELCDHFEFQFEAGTTMSLKEESLTKIRFLIQCLCPS
jgi:hypothetical protein